MGEDFVSHIGFFTNVERYSNADNALQAAGDVSAALVSSSAMKRICRNSEARAGHTAHDGGMRGLGHGRGRGHSAHA